VNAGVSQSPITSNGRPHTTKRGALVECTSSEPTSAERPLRVFVFLAHGFGASQWIERWSRGEIPGLNERLPYGYYRAANSNCVIEYSEDARESRLNGVARRSLRRLLGCDLVHAWRNRRGLFEADAVWTHTELEHLAVLALWQCRRRVRRPLLIAQSVWLFDRWRSLSRLKRWLYRRLINQADILTTLSPDNLTIARELFPQVRSEFIRFGVNADSLMAPARCAVHSPLRIVAAGNDMHRDWETLIAAAERWPGCCVRIASRQLDSRVANRAPNVHVTAASSATEVAELYSWADIAVVPLKPNLHASGLTVIFEAVLRGLPVVCTDTGGLRAYFSEDAARYVPPRDPSALRRALEELARDDQMRFAMAKRAQARILCANLSSRAFAERHYELSRQLLADAVHRQAKAEHLRRPA
jgi:glycosyltransferase involved in cell wall biosynthesis